jgi:drug/metabolite transporter (DMT)-like permease
MQMLTGAVALTLFAALTGETATVDIAAISMTSIWALLYLIIPGAVGYIAYIWLLQVTTPAKVATYAYVNPVIALLLGSLIGGETISAWTLGCSVVIIGAVFLIISNKTKSPAANTPNSPEVVCTAADDICLSGEAALACDAEVEKA